MESPTSNLQESLKDWNAAAGKPGPEAAGTLLAAAESLLAPGISPAPNPATEAEVRNLHDFLEATGGVPAFLTQLDETERRRWVDTALAAVRRSGYTLETMLEHRSREIGDRTLFREYGTAGTISWSYSRVRSRVRAVAAVFLGASPEDEPPSNPRPEPRVALFTENSVAGACCDLACLLHDILVTPLNVHFDVDQLVWIFDRLGITCAVADTEERLRRLIEVRSRVRIPFELHALSPHRIVERGEAQLLESVASRLPAAEIESRLARRPRRALDDVCTVMFTSGSTGNPKGVAFTQYNLVSKRFARAAALPAVGEDEILFCYLPLFHTFGRYLEMLGMLFWRGTYVFAGNPSRETLLAGLRHVRPTGLISIPLRWTQIRDRALDAMERADSEETREAAFRSVVGDRLRWGLSAAGYLDPRVFRFFQTRAVELCSGFGMTEATGGITMSPPGDYVENTVGRPLPGVEVTLTDQGEMRIAGAYVARYLAEEGEALELAPTLQENGRDWIATGDLFRELERGHLTIVDRLKDIYKNDRGQTVAPRRVEQAMAGVPGVKRAFLVGDHRSYNVLLIVPDLEDPILVELATPESRREYFHRIVVAGNLNLAPYERVVNFAVLDRDFEIERGEITPKLTYRRRTIETNFAATIEELYRHPWVERRCGSLQVRIPRWFIRDLGILEEDLVVHRDGLHDRRRGLDLVLAPGGGADKVRMGDLEYAVEGRILDLGIFARQPLLWAGNPQLGAFAPCKEGWDAGLGGVSPRVTLPAMPRKPPGDEVLSASGVRDAGLRRIHRLLGEALLTDAQTALPALESLAAELATADDRVGALLRCRLPALSRHPEEPVRCLAYRTLLLDEPKRGYDEAFGSFLASGLTFLDEPSIGIIASTNFEHRRLESLRRRLSLYRARLEWPASEVIRGQLERILVLLVRFARNNPRYYHPVRMELATWSLLREDPVLADTSRRHLAELVTAFESHLESGVGGPAREPLADHVVFDGGVAPGDRRRLLHLFGETAFLEQAVALTFEEGWFRRDGVTPEGIWVSVVTSRDRFRMFRVSINTVTDRHFDLLVILREDMDAEEVELTNYWMLAISGYPFGPRVLPRFGCARPDLGAMALEYLSELTVEEKIREFTRLTHPDVTPPPENEWRRVFVWAMAAFIRAWNYSGRRIVPGHPGPANVVVPEQDFRAGAMVLSLAGWVPYEGPLSLFAPLCRNFYRRTRAIYPSVSSLLNVEWVFEACREALPPADARTLLTELLDAARSAPAGLFDASFLPALERDLADATQAHLPLALENAINRHRAWRQVNPLATGEASIGMVESLIPLYGLDRLPEIVRFELYRRTCFEESDATVLEAFDRLLTAMRTEPGLPASRRVELSDLQETLTRPGDRDAFSRLVFPQAHRPLGLDVLTYGDRAHPQVTIRTRITDQRGETHEVREPMGPEEVGQLYRLFFRRHFPKMVSEFDRFLVAVDEGGRVVAGICYQLQKPEVVHMDGVVVNAALAGRGIATALLDDFCARMAGQGVEVVKTTYFMRAFCEKRDFQLDRRWGGMVRFLGSA